MKHSSTALDLLIGAVLKLKADNGERKNVMAFIQSCYGGLVRTYDFDAALSALAKLTDEEQNALIAWTVVKTENLAQIKVPVRV